MSSARSVSCPAPCEVPAVLQRKYEDVAREALINAERVRDLEEAILAARAELGAGEGEAIDSPANLCFAVLTHALERDA